MSSDGATGTDRNSRATGRRSRLDEGETRRRMLDIAVIRLVDEGVTVGLDAVRMEEIIKEAKVSRATAYRAWPSRADFLGDVLTETVRRTALLPETGEDLARLSALIDSHRDDLLDEQGRRDVIVEALRIAADGDVRREIASPHWRLYHSLSATHVTLPEGLRESIAATLAETEDTFVARRAGIYAGLAHLIGYRLTAPWEGETGFLHMSRMAGITMHGLITEALPRPAWLDERRSSALFGQSAPSAWSGAEIALVSVFLTYLEPDPQVRWTPGLVAEHEKRLRETITQLYSGTAQPPG